MPAVACKAAAVVRMGQGMDVLASCDGNCHSADEKGPAGKKGQAPRSKWDEDAGVGCAAIEDGLQHAMANANRGGARVSDAVLLNHELLQHARQGNLRGLSEALDKGAWTETRRPLVMKPQKPEVGAKNKKGEQHDVGMTALMFASQTGSAECVRRLLLSNAEINAREEDGWTPLHFAAKEAQLDVCKVLLEARAQPLLKNCDEKTPLQLAVDEEDDNGDFVAKLKKLLEATKEVDKKYVGEQDD